MKEHQLFSSIYISLDVSDSISDTFLTPCQQWTLQKHPFAVVPCDRVLQVVRISSVSVATEK